MKSEFPYDIIEKKIVYDAYGYIEEALTSNLDSHVRDLLERAEESLRKFVEK